MFGPVRSRKEWEEYETQHGDYTFRVSPNMPNILTILTSLDDPHALNIFAPKQGDKWRTRFDPSARDDYQSQEHTALHSDANVGAQGVDGTHCHIEFGVTNGTDNFIPMEDDDQINELIAHLQTKIPSGK